MEKKRSFFTGEDAGINVSVTFGEQEPFNSLDDYEVDVEVLTTHLGEKFVASTRTGSFYPVVRAGGNKFGFNVPADVTARMTPGNFTVSMAFTHIGTGMRKIIEDTSMLLRESKIGLGKLR